MRRSTYAQFSAQQELQMVQELACREKTLTALAGKHGGITQRSARWRVQITFSALDLLAGGREDSDAEAQDRNEKLEQTLGHNTMLLVLPGRA